MPPNRHVAKEARRRIRAERPAPEFGMACEVVLVGAAVGGAVALAVLAAEEVARGL